MFSSRPTRQRLRTRPTKGKSQPTPASSRTAGRPATNRLKVLNVHVGEHVDDMYHEHEPHAHIASPHSKHSSMSLAVGYHQPHVHAVESAPEDTHTLTAMHDTGSPHSITVPVSVALDTPTIIPTLYAISTTILSDGHPMAPSTSTATISLAIPANTLADTSPQTISIQPTVSTMTHLVYSSTSLSLSSSSTPDTTTGSAIPVTAYIAGGLGMLAAGALVLILCLCKRQTKVREPISKPIPRDVFQADSPMFGGHEKLSNKRETLAWTQYTLPYQGVATEPQSTNSSWDANFHTLMKDTEFSNVPLDDPVANLALPATSAPTLANTISQSLSRISASMFPQPPSIPHIDVEAARTPTTLYPLASTDEVNYRKSTMSRLSTRTSVYGGYLISSSPVPPPTPSPILPASVPRSTSSHSGRARIKTPYKVGHFNRPSVAASVPDTTFAIDDMTYKLPRLPSTYAQVHARANDESWLLAFDGTTLRPEDSVSCVDDRVADEERDKLRKLAVQSVEDSSIALEERRRQREDLARSMTDATTTLGSLMLEDFGASTTSKSIRTLARPKRDNSTTSIGPLKVHKKPVRQPADQPPRVPSPPPLPSLAQMAMERDDPHYRSPTYSLYACYEDRKSRLVN